MLTNDTGSIPGLRRSSVQEVMRPGRQCRTPAGAAPFMQDNDRRCRRRGYENQKNRMRTWSDSRPSPVLKERKQADSADETDEVKERCEIRTRDVPPCMPGNKDASDKSENSRRNRRALRKQIGFQGHLVTRSYPPDQSRHASMTEHLSAPGRREK